MMTSLTWKTALYFTMVWGLFISVAPAAILYLEDFDDGANGWTDRDAGEMTVAYDGANEWMSASFAAQGFPIFQQDALTITSGSDFTGNYVTMGITQLSFDFYSASVLPSQLYMILRDGENAFTYQFTPTLVGQFQTFTVDMVWSYGWDGGTESEFNTLVRSIDSVEIEITRNTTASQQYYIDNITTYDTDIGEPVGGVVPEPTTVSLFIMAVVCMVIVRRKLSFYQPQYRTAGNPPGANGENVQKAKWMINSARNLMIAALIPGLNASAGTLETFDSAPAWQSTSSMGGGYWSLEGGEAKLTFYDTTPFPIPDAGILSVDSGDVNFMGDYDEHGLDVIGFSFLAPSELPSGHVVLEWGGEGAVFQKGFMVETTGVWHRFTASLETADAGSWHPVTGTMDDFAAARQQVDRIAIRVQRTGTTQREYIVDDLFVAGKPTGRGSMVAHNLLQIDFDDLVPGMPYLLESATNVAGPWRVEREVTSTNVSRYISVTNESPTLYLRLKFP